MIRSTAYAVDAAKFDVKYDYILLLIIIIFLLIIIPQYLHDDDDEDRHHQHLGFPIATLILYFLTIIINR